MKTNASTKATEIPEKQSGKCPIWIQSISNGCRIRVHVTPRASKTEITGVHGEALAVRLQAPPVDGKANQALCSFFAEALGVSKRSVQVVSGDTSREKVLAIAGVGDAEALERLGNP